MEEREGGGVGVREREGGGGEKWEESEREREREKGKRKRGGRERGSQREFCIVLMSKTSINTQLLVLCIYNTSTVF